MKSILTLIAVLLGAYIAVAQDTSKKIVINNLQTLKSKGFSDINADTLHSNKFKYKGSAIRHDTTNVIYNVKSSLKLKFDDGYIKGEIKEVSKNVTDARIEKSVKTTSVLIKMVACCTGSKVHPRHCCDPSEIKSYCDKYKCTGWTFVAANN